MTVSGPVSLSESMATGAPTGVAVGVGVTLVAGWLLGDAVGRVVGFDDFFAGTRCEAALAAVNGRAGGAVDPLGVDVTVGSLLGANWARR